MGQVIIVTGERVARPLRETPSSVIVIADTELNATPGANRLDQLLESIPNITLGTGSLGPTIRGQDTTGALQDLPAFLGGNRPRVTLQVDGRVVGFNEFVFGVAPVWDVDQIEIFRSPQTTTQGRNSIAGAIFIRTKDPTYDWEARARAIAGSFHGRQISAVLSGPIASELAFRISGDIRRGRSPSRIKDVNPGADPNDDNFSLLRARLLAEPKALPRSRVELIYTHSESESHPAQVVMAPFHERRNDRGAAGVFKTNIDALVASLAIELEHSLSLRATTSYGASRIGRFPPPGLGRTDTHIEDMSFETLLDWKPVDPIRGVLGVHFLKSRIDQTIDLSAVLGRGAFDDDQRSFGIFGEATVQLLRRLSVTGGLRYQRDAQRRRGALGAPAMVFVVDFDRKFQAWLPKFSVAYRLTDQVVAGALVQRAYNPGGTTLNLATGQQQNFEAESVWSYELFARIAFAERFKVSTNAFYNRFRDTQRSTFFPLTGPGGRMAFWARIDNVPKAETYGLEASFEWRPSDRLQVRAGLGLLRSRIVQPANQAPELEGNDFGRSPRWTASGIIAWRPLKRLELNAVIRHNAGYFSDDANVPNRRVGHATRIDARAAYDFGRTTLFGYARNVLDHFHMTYLFAPTAGVAADPREVGIGFEARF
ncbi:MAG TPA: TonB-dependent receptor [Sphingomicrobium sp.]|nr:TonB-dependent receptor [Sphingomicrobium sp.]